MRRSRSSESSSVSTHQATRRFFGAPAASQLKSAIILVLHRGRATERWRAMMKLARIMTCGIALLALSVHYAAAAPALATNNVNMRQGPGTNYPVVTTIPGGSNVEV